MITFHFHLQPQYKYELFPINFTKGSGRCNETGVYHCTFHFEDRTTDVFLLMLVAIKKRLEILSKNDTKRVRDIEHESLHNARFF